MLSRGPWQMTYGERAALEGMLAQLRPALAIEIGTAEGGSLSRVAAYSDEVHSFDLVAPRLPVGGYDHVTLHAGDGHKLLPEFLAEQAQAGRNVDFVLVDGDHSTAGVKRDIVDLLESDAVGDTLIVLHDTINEVVRAGIDAVDYEAYDKVRAYDPDSVPGTMSIHDTAYGQLWGGIGVIVCSRSPLDLGLAGPRVKNCVSPTNVGLGARALAGPGVEQHTDFVELVDQLKSSRPKILRSTRFSLIRRQT